MSQEISDIQNRVETLRLNKARAEAAIESAQASLDKTMQELRSQFGLDNLEQAHATLAELKTAVQTELDIVKAQLNEIEQ
jgi:multidrug resistance efflux pump